MYQNHFTIVHNKVFTFANAYDILITVNEVTTCYNNSIENLMILYFHETRENEILGRKGAYQI